MKLLDLSPAQLIKRLIGITLIASFFPLLFVFMHWLDPTGNNVIKPGAWPYMKETFSNVVLIGIFFDTAIIIFGAFILLIFWFFDMWNLKNLLAIICVFSVLNGFSQSTSSEGTAYTIPILKDSVTGPVVTIYTVTGTRSGFKVVTDYPCVFQKIHDKFDSVYKSFTVQNKQDRAGKFKRYTFYFENGQEPPVHLFLDTLNTIE